MESYKVLCERRIKDFDPQHPLPVLPEHIGVQPDQILSTGDFKRQLALKEQDLVYARQRAEKAASETESYKREVAELKTLLAKKPENAEQSAIQNH